MFIKPGIDRTRFRENLAERMAASGKQPGEVAGMAQLEEAAFRDLALTGFATDEQIAGLAKGLGVEPHELAPRLSLRDADRGDHLPPEGRDVPESEFWMRRLGDGDVVRAEPPQEAQDAPKPEGVSQPGPSETPA